jgi:tetratricopeptide (TPR) repeat protein
MRIGFFLRIILSATCIFLFNPGSSAGQSLSDSLIRSGNRKIETGNYDEAKKDFEQVLAQHPSSNPALNGKITIMYLQGNTREAGREIERAIEKDPSYADFYYSRGMIANQRRNYRRAVEDFNLALALKPANLSRIYLNRGISRLNLNDDQIAIEDFTMAIFHNPQNTAAYNYRGMVNYRNRLFDTAIEDFDKIITIDPDNDVAHYNRAMAYLRSGDSRSACFDFHISCKLGNRNACQMIIMECQ